MRVSAGRPALCWALAQGWAQPWPSAALRTSGLRVQRPRESAASPAEQQDAAARRRAAPARLLCASAGTARGPGCPSSTQPLAAPSFGRSVLRGPGPFREGGKEAGDGRAGAPVPGCQDSRLRRPQGVLTAVCAKPSGVLVFLADPISEGEAGFKDPANAVEATRAPQRSPFSVGPQPTLAG